MVIVFSTYVEVILTFTIDDPTSHGFLHVCGGDPCLVMLAIETTMFSPRMWR